MSTRHEKGWSWPVYRSKFDSASHHMNVATDLDLDHIRALIKIVYKWCGSRGPSRQKSLISDSIDSINHPLITLPYKSNPVSSHKPLSVPSLKIGSNIKSLDSRPFVTNIQKLSSMAGFRPNSKTLWSFWIKR